MSILTRNCNIPLWKTSVCRPFANVLLFRLLALVLFYLCRVSDLYAQTGWQTWETIYSDGDITVEVQFYHSTTACDSYSNKPFKYRGRITGRYKTSPSFVNFKTSYTNCNGDPVWRYISFEIWKSSGDRVSKYLLESMDYSFTASSMIQTYYQVTLETSRKTGTGTGVGVSLESKKAAEIIGNRLINYGESTQLSVKGGKLGVGADWYWYADNCGSNFIGKGNSVDVSPTSLTRYYVRAEGKYNITDCQSTTVDVNLKSTGATSIDGPTDYCEGGTGVLIVKGGNLGQGAKWIWYERGCGGSDGKKIGEGNKIKISPTSNTEYYVRAEGPYNISTCVSKSVRIISQSKAASQIISNTADNTICQGTTVELSLKGGKLAEDAEWVWYSDECGSNRIGSGISIKVTPNKSTVYYVRAEGACRQTICISHKLSVWEESIPPIQIKSNNDKLTRGQKTVLSIEGGKLGEGAKWRWYEGACGGSPVAYGTTIAVRPKKNTTYFVRAEGKCNISPCVSRRIEPLRRHRWSDSYDAGNGIRKLVHIGFGCGTSYYQQKRYVQADYFNYNGTFLFSNSETLTFNNQAITGQLDFRPIMKESISIGFNASGSFGLFYNDDSYNYDVDYYFKRLNIGSEFVLGAKPIKLLFKLDRSVQPYNFSKYPKNDYFYSGYTTYSLVNTFRNEMISAGLRFGRYTRGNYDENKPNIDLVYTLCRLHGNSITQFSGDDYSFLPDWFAGLGVDWWVQSRYRIKFELQFNIRQGDMNWVEPDFSQSTFNFSIILNKDFFY
jgi:hypothetical protein